MRIVILEDSGKPEEVYAANRREDGSEASLAADTAHPLAEAGTNRHLFSVAPETLNAPSPPRTEQ